MVLTLTLLPDSILIPTCSVRLVTLFSKPAKSAIFYTALQDEPFRYLCITSQEIYYVYLIVRSVHIRSLLDSQRYCQPQNKFVSTLTVTVCTL